MRHERAFVRGARSLGHAGIDVTCRRPEQLFTPTRRRRSSPINDVGIRQRSHLGFYRRVASRKAV